MIEFGQQSGEDGPPSRGRRSQVVDARQHEGLVLSIKRAARYRRMARKHAATLEAQFEETPHRQAG